MRKNLPVTDNEVHFSNEYPLISSTNPKGVIQFVNDRFCEVAKFSAEELIGQAHNIVRHPDMPQAAFEDMWSSLNKGEPWMGIVKNRCQNGDYYWVDAFVSPVRHNNEVVAFESVRIIPEEKTLARAKQAYEKINKNKSVLHRWTRIKFFTKLFLGNAIALSIPPASLWFINEIGMTTASAIYGSSLLLSSGLHYFLFKNYRQVVSHSKAIIDNPLMQHIYTGSSCEENIPQLAILHLKGMIRTVTERIKHSCQNLHKVSEAARLNSEETSNTVQDQQQNLEVIASSISEMSATSQDIAENTQHASESSKQVSDEVGNVRSVIEHTLNQIQILTENVTASVLSIEKLEEQTQDISTIVDSISGIAEKTNLLALNAAIEAARAGEQGRGFAVVADEVRTLAQSSAEATLTISSMIENLNDAVKSAVKSMHEDSQVAQELINNAESTQAAIDTMANATDKIVSMNDQVAVATEQQYAVANDINMRVAGVFTASVAAGRLSKNNLKSIECLENSIQELTELVSRF